MKRELLESFTDHESLNKRVSNVLSYDMDDGVTFDDQFRLYLLFDNLFISEIKDFRVFLEEQDSDSLLIGCLSENGAVIPLAGEVERHAAFRIKKNCDDSLIRQIFDLKLESAESLNIATYVKSAIVLPNSGDWVIWFSTYWEIAIAAFVDCSAAKDFSERHSRLDFFSNSDIEVRQYGGKIPEFISRLLKGNFVDSNECC